MEMQISFQKFSKILKFGMNFINPYDGAAEGVRLKRLYRFFIATHISMIIVIIAFCMFEDPSMAATTEAVAVALVYVRSMFYLVMMIAKNAKWQAILGKIVDERKSVCPLDKKFFDLTIKYCNVEVRLSILGFVIYWVIVTVALIFFPSLQLNDLRLPFNFYIPGLHFEGLGWKWFLCYAFQLLHLLSIAIFFIFCVPLTPLLMNQVCLKVDEGVLLVEKLSKLLTSTDFSSEKPKTDETKATTSWATTSGATRKIAIDDSKAMRNSEIKELIQRIAEMINSVNEWREESQDLIQLIFLIEFVILSFCFSLCLFTITENDVGSIPLLVGFCDLLFVLFLYCWLGTRLDIRVEKFAASLYDIEWHEMNVQQQKDIQLMLTMIQNIEGFDGIFERVNFETFKEILNFSYSMFTVLKAIT